MYSILFFCIIILSIILVKLLKLNINTLFTILLTLSIIFFVINPSLSISSATDGAKLFVKSILPTMFPFMVICNMIIALDGIKMYSKTLGPIICKPLNLSYSCSFAIIASLLCGYPLGSKYATDLYRNNLISHKEFIRLLNIASNIGPLFLIGAVGTSMLNNTYLGYLLLIPSYLSCFIIGIITKEKKEENLSISPQINLNPSSQTKSLGEVIKTSIQDAANNILVICGYIVIFSVIINMINFILPHDFIFIICEKLNISIDLVNAILLGSIESTNGCNIVTSSNLNITTQLCIISFLCSFGGLSIIAQTISFFYNEKVSMSRYFFLKFIQGIISFIIMFFTYNIFKNPIAASATPNVNLIFMSPILLLLFLTLIILLIYKLVLTS